MLALPIRIVPLITLLSLVYGSLGGCATIKVYEGKRLPEREVVRVYDSRDLSVTAIEGKGFARDQRPHTFELSPGVRRLWVAYSRPEGLSYIRRGINLASLSYDFKPGGRYTFAVQTVEVPRVSAGAAGFWLSMLVDKQTGEVVAHAETGREPAPQRATDARGAMLTGVAYIRQSDEMIIHACGRSVQLVPKSPEISDYYKKYDHWVARGRPAPFFGMLSDGSPKPPPQLEKQSRRTVGYGTGQFVFHDVPPGEYILRFEHHLITNYLTLDTDLLIASREIVVQAGQPRIDGIVLAREPSRGS